MKPNEALCRELVFSYFKDAGLVDLWFRTPNPLLGNIPPEDIGELKGYDKLLEFIQYQIGDNDEYMVVDSSEENFYSSVDVVQETDFDPENVRVRVSVMVPSDVLVKLREMGREQGRSYQDLATEILSEWAKGNDSTRQG